MLRLAEFWALVEWRRHGPDCGGYRTNGGLGYRGDGFCVFTWRCVVCGDRNASPSEVA